MAYEFSEKEKELSGLVKGICQYKDTYVGVMLASTVYGFVEETIEYIRKNPDVDQEDLTMFISERIPEEDDTELAEAL